MEKEKDSRPNRHLYKCVGSVTIEALIAYKKLTTHGITKEERAELNIEVVKLFKRQVGIYNKQQNNFLSITDVLKRLGEVRYGFYRSNTNKSIVEDILKVMHMLEGDYQYNKVDFTKYCFVGIKPKHENSFKISLPDFIIKPDTSWYELAIPSFSEELARLHQRLGLDQTTLVLILIGLLKADYPICDYFNLSLSELENM